MYNMIPSSISTKVRDLFCDREGFFKVNVTSEDVIEFINRELTNQVAVYPKEVAVKIFTEDDPVI